MNFHHTSSGPKLSPACSLDSIETFQREESNRKPMAIVEYERNGFLISTNKSKLDINLIHDYLSNSSYWAKNRPMDVVKKSIQHSLCFGVYAGSQQIGFARVITDYATFAWLCDVFILESHRSQSLGKWLVECIVRHPELQGLCRIMLVTQDAHQLYQKYGGFQLLQHPEWIMERVTPAPQNPKTPYQGQA